MDFKKEFAELLSSTNLPTNASQDKVNEVWTNIYQKLIPNIPNKLYRDSEKLMNIV